MWFPFPLGGITCERVAQVTPPQPAWRGALGVCVWEIWALPPYLHREGPHCNSCHHLSSTDICTGIAQIFPGVFFQIFSPLFNIRILLEYQHMCCTNLTQMVHGGGVHCSCNRHHTGRGRVSITLIRLAQILHRYCIYIAYASHMRIKSYNMLQALHVSGYQAGLSLASLNTHVMAQTVH